MDVTLVSLIVALIVICLTIFILKRFNSNKGDKNKPDTDNREVRAPNNRARVNTLARARLANRLAARRQNDGNNIDEDIAEVHNFAANLNLDQNTNHSDDDNDDRNEDDEKEEREKLRKKIGTKKLAKLEAKAERKEQYEQMQRDREERKEREKKLEEERRLREAEEKLLEKAKEEEEKRLKEEQERKEYEEYLKLKEEFSIEEEGHDQTEADLNDENALQKFINFIKDAKVVILEDLAAEFKLRTQDIINRINHVQEMGLLSGVFDDRGKYIYISEEELKKVCTFIRQRGRVSISELAQSSNELINLKPSLPQIDDEVAA